MKSLLDTEEGDMIDIDFADLYGLCGPETESQDSGSILEWTKIFPLAQSRISQDEVAGQDTETQVMMMMMMLLILMMMMMMKKIMMLIMMMIQDSGFDPSDPEFQLGDSWSNSVIEDSLETIRKGNILQICARKIDI